MDKVSDACLYKSGGLSLPYHSVLFPTKQDNEIECIKIEMCVNEKRQRKAVKAVTEGLGALVSLEACGHRNLCNS